MITGLQAGFINGFLPRLQTPKLTAAEITLRGANTVCRRQVIDTIRGGRYTEEGKFLPWAMRIAHNLCVDHFRKVKRTPAIKTSDDRDIFEVINFTEDGADVKMMKRQSHDRVRQMLDLLPEDQREVIILRHYADLSFKEIASLTNCSINTALGRMRYGLINLRKMMTQKKIAL